MPCQTEGGIVQTSEAYCEAMGGTWIEPPKDPDCGCTGPTGQLHVHIAELLASNTHTTTAQEIRDEILQNTTVGQGLLRLYHQHLAAFLTPILSDSQLMMTFMSAWIGATPFLINLLRMSKLNTTEQQGFDVLEFRSATFDLISVVCDEIYEQSDNEDFRTAVREGQAVLSRFVGLTAGAAMTELKRSSAL